MPTFLPLKKMSRPEKLRALEEIWTDLSENDQAFESPAWHQDALRAAEKAVSAGTAKFSDWDKVKQRLRRKVSKLK